MLQKEALEVDIIHILAAVHTWIAFMQSYYIPMLQQFHFGFPVTSQMFE